MYWGDFMYQISKVETGKRIRKLMTEFGVTVREVQEEMNLESPQAVYKWLNGRALPSVENLVILGKILHVPVEELLVFEIKDADQEEAWKKKHPPVFMAHRLNMSEPVRKADAEKWTLYLENMTQDRLRVVTDDDQSSRSS